MHLVIDDLSFDPTIRTATYHGEDIVLTPTESVILEHLMRTPGIVVPREIIRKGLRDFAKSAYSNVVDVHVKNLRNKLKPVQGISIETIRSVGYRLVA